MRVRCNGTKRYALRCKALTDHPSGLCGNHRDQSWADVRTEAGAGMASAPTEVVIQIPRVEEE